VAELLSVAALTGGVGVPSARFRVGQHVAPLREHGVAMRWLPAPVSKYPPRRRWLLPLWLPATVAARIPAVAATRRADVTLLQRELVSTLSTLEGLTRRPRVLDVDDAIWVRRRGGGYLDRIARACDLVIAGNDFVADWFADRGPRVEVLPTAVDTSRFRPIDGPPVRDDGRIVLGWSGTSSNLAHMRDIEGALARVLRERPQCVLAISADRAPALAGLPADRIEYVPWSPDAEVPFCQGLDVGLMPLRDSDWSRGKCAFKMLLYLACGRPAVVSPVGMNAQVLARSDVGFGPRSEDEWVDALLALVDDARLRTDMGARGRELVTSRYSVDVIAPRLAALLEGVVR